MLETHLFLVLWLQFVHFYFYYINLSEVGTSEVFLPRKSKTKKCLLSHSVVTGRASSLNSHASVSPLLSQVSWKNKSNAVFFLDSDLSKASVLYLPRQCTIFSFCVGFRRERWLQAFKRFQTN